MSTHPASDSQSAIRRFIDHEATGGLILAATALLAIVLVNAGFSQVYETLLEQRVSIGVGSLTLDKSLHHFINDGLMAVFFFLVGLEIKREAREGSLSSFDQIVLPAVAALGGIAAPALIFAAFNANSATLQGWAIPAATDIAFALGALAIVGTRVPLSLKVFLLALATLDDLAAIIIIALFYSSGLSWLAVAGALACLTVLVALNRTGVMRISAYILVGLLLWLCVLKSGVHATLAGVALGLCIPLRRSDGSSPIHELEEWLHPYVKFLILPLFAFANAGLSLEGFSMKQLLQPLPLGIMLGLALGKPLGIMLAVGASLATGIAKMPEGASFRHVFGVACLAGIGFTMSLFIGSLAFESLDLQAQVRLGVIAGSIVSLAAGFAVLMSGRRKS